MQKFNKRLAAIVIELRPAQWLKNLFVFAGLIFSLSFVKLLPILQSLLGFVIFCLASSAVYIFNDIIDRESDALHNNKKNRPIASGILGIKLAIFVSILLFALSISLSLLLNLYFFSTCLLYIILMIIYSLLLKKIIILDVITIAFGFILRAVAGAVAIKVSISPWLLLTTFLIALFLALCKRRYELTSLGEYAGNHRKTLSQYSPYLLDQMIAVVTASTVVTYSLYTLARETYLKFGTRFLGFTIPFVIYGIFRYLFLIHSKQRGGSPESTLLTDKPLLIDILLWGISSIFIIYFSQKI
ncbi:MAG: decaprenyl-phosphate phosphoribosyltransferase [Candidatus Cloacimonas sp. 4484_209]|nr:MAG: decaprenyl-phosphate phosphoribosyltransferase [Candidatus Cloacimonas sp. 4484_209]